MKQISGTVVLTEPIGALRVSLLKFKLKTTKK